LGLGETPTISGAWVNTREMTPVNFSRCAGSIASFSAAKMGYSPTATPRRLQAGQAL
jgi:hypothetical protein